MKIILLLLFLITTSAIYARVSYPDYPSVTDSLLHALEDSPQNVDLNLRLSAQAELPKAEREQYAQCALQQAMLSEDIRGEVHARIQLALFKRSRSEYREAFAEYYKIEKQCQKHQLDSLLGECYYLTGVLHKELEQDQLAMEYLQKAIRTLSMTQHDKALGNSYHSYASMLYDQGLKREALMHYRKSMELVSGKALMQVAPMNSLGLYYMEEKMYDSAHHYFERGLALSASIGHYESQSVFCNNLGILHYYENKLDSAKVYFDSAYTCAILSESPVNLPAVYNSLSELYYHQGNYKEAYTYKLKEESCKDSLMGEGKRNQVYALYNEELSNKKEKELDVVQGRLTRNLNSTYALEGLLLVFVLLGLLILLLASLRIRKLKRYLREEEEQKLICMHLADDRIRKNKTEYEQVRKHNDNLRKKLKHTQTTLEKVGMELAHYIDVLEKLRNKSRTLAHRTGQDKETQLKELHRQIELQFQVAKHDESLRSALSDCREQFTKRLLKRYPDLTGNEVQLCMLIQQGLSSKDIAHQRGISTKAVEMGRYRIRKKMDLPANTALTDSLSRI